MQQRATFTSDSLRHYLDRWPAEAAVVAQFESFLHTQAHAFHRSNVAGHFTGSAWLVSADGKRALLMHHRKLGRWLQPGGHADGEHDLSAVALREAEEETGVQRLHVDKTIFDIDRHRIAERGDEPEHWHYDVRFVVRAGDDERFVVNQESISLAWRDVADVAADTTLDESLRRMAAKWLARARD